MAIRDLVRRAPAALTEPRVEFLGEQDGPPEREFKAEVSADFATVRDVRRAYLADESWPLPEELRGVRLLRDFSSRPQLNSGVRPTSEHVTGAS